ncbi:MAG: pentapeptide repeat-containing protein [Cyanobacteria bacterium J06642_9]
MIPPIRWPMIRISIGVLSLIGVATSVARAENPDQVRQLLQTNACENCDLSDAVLDGLDLAEANLQGANLQGASLLGTRLNRANLRGASLQNASLAGTNLLGANLQNADLSDVQVFNHCESNDVFDGTGDDSEDISQCYAFGLLQQFSSELCDEAYGLQDLLENDEPSGFCDSDQASLQYAVALGYGSFSSAGILSWIYPGLGNRIVLIGANLRGANLSNVNLSGADLRYAQFEDAVLQATQLDYALLLDATGLPADLANLDRALLTKADIGEVIGSFFGPAASSFFATYTVSPDGAALVGSMNRAQQAYHLETNIFASQLDDLGVGIDAETDGYQIEVAYVGGDYVVNTAIAQEADLESYLGIVYITQDVDYGDTITSSILCKTSEPLTELPFIPPRPATTETQMLCPAGFEPG